MKGVERKETIGNGRECLTRSKERREEAAAIGEKDLISRLPLDLKLQILVKLPAKCIAKFNFVSKLWSSIARGKDLTELFISRSSTRPSFLFTDVIGKFHYRSQEEPSSGNLINIPNPIVDLPPPVRGLICGEEIGNRFSKVICNPSTGQSVNLPRVETRGSRPAAIRHFLGYDPVDDVYKVLCMTVRRDAASHQPDVTKEHQVFTLGAKKKEWRMIECKHPHYPATNGFCRDGVVYYGARYYSHEKEGSLIVSFDVRSEEFGVIKLPEDVRVRLCAAKLVNYHGKITLANPTSTRFTCNVDLWVLQDLKKQEWSKISFSLPDIVRSWSRVFFCKGTISTGGIIFAPSYKTNPFFLLYYDLKKNSARRVDIEGVRDSGDKGDMTVFLDHVESPMFLQNEV